MTQPWATSSSQNDLWVPLVINSKLHQHTIKRWPWTPQDPLTLFATLHTSSQNTLWLCRISHALTVNKNTIRRTLKGIEKTWDYTNQETLWSDLVLVQSLTTILQIFWKILSKTNLNLYFKLFKTCILFWKKGYIYSTWKLVVQGNINELKRFWSHSKQLKQVFKKLLWKYTINQLKPL